MIHQEKRYKLFDRKIVFRMKKRIIGISIILAMLTTNIGFIPSAYAANTNGNGIFETGSTEDWMGQYKLAQAMIDSLKVAAAQTTGQNQSSTESTTSPLPAGAATSQSITDNVYQSVQNTNMIDKVIDYPAFKTSLSTDKPGQQSGQVFMKHVIHMPNVVEKPVPYTPKDNRIVNVENPLINETVSNNVYASGSIIKSDVVPNVVDQDIETFKSLMIKDMNTNSINLKSLNLTDIGSDNLDQDETVDESVSEDVYNQQIDDARSVVSSVYKTSNYTFPIRNNEGNYSIGFSRWANNNLFRFSFKKAELTLGPENTDSVVGKVYKNSILYQDIYPETDLKYTVEPTRLKEELIVQSYTGQNQFLFQLSVANAVYQIMSDSTIMFSDPDSGQPLFFIPPSYAVDSEGNRCDNITMEFTEEGLLQISIDADWLAQAVYPVTIDPTINLFDATFSRNSVAYKQDGTQVASGTPRYEAAKFNQGIMVEEGTTNLLTANQSSVETDLTGLYAWGPSGNPTFTRDTSTAWHGSASAKAVATVNDTFDIFVDDMAVTANQPYAFSAYVKGQTSSGRQVWAGIDWYSGSTYLSSAFGSLNTLSGNWQRLITAGTAPANATKASIYIQVIGALTGEILWTDGLQFGQKPYATSWTLGGTTREAETLTIPTEGVFQKGNWTVELTFKPTSSPQNTTGRYARLWRCKIDASNDYIVFIDPTGGVYGGVHTGGTWYGTPLSTPLVIGDSYFISFSGNGSVLRLCINGAQIGTDIGYVEPMGTLPAIMTIGYDHEWAGTQVDGIIDDLRISNRARTFAGHQAAYQSNQPLTVDVSTTCKFNFDGGTSGYSTTEFGSGVEPYWNYTSMDLGGGWNASVNTWNKNLILTKSLFSIPGRGLAIGEDLTYNSISKTWTFGNITSLENPDGSVTFNKGDGGSYTFTPNGSGGYTVPAGIYLTLQKNSTGNFTLLDKYKNTYNYINGKPNQFADRNNNMTTFTYDSNGRLYQVTDPSERKLTYAYNSQGNISSLTDPASHVYQFGYQNGNLTSITDPDNKTFSLSYDANGNISTFTDPLNRVTTFYSGPNGQIQRLRDARTSGQNIYETSFTQSLQDNSILTLMTDPGNKTSTFYHDNNTGNLTQYQDALGHTWQYTWNNNNLMQSQDAKGTTSYQYDTNGNITSETITVDSNSSNNIVETMTYDSYSQLLQETDGSGRITSYKYSNKGELLSTANPNIKESNGRKYDQYGNAIEYSPPVLGTYNLLTNGSMETPGIGSDLLDHWTRYGGTATASLDGSQTGYHPHGNYSLKISSSTATTDRFDQLFPAYPYAHLTLSANVKLDNVQPSGSDGGAFIGIYYNSGSDRYYEYWYCWGSGTVPLTLTSNAVPDYPCSYSVRIGLSKASGTVWFDGVQLENAGYSTEGYEGYTLGSFNSVDNSSFEQDLYYWNYPGTTASVTTEAAWGGTRSLKIQDTGTVYRDVPVHGGEPLTLSGMVKTDNVTGNGAYYKIDYYDSGNNLITDSTVQTGYVTGTQDFTRLTSLASAPANASYARVQCILDGSGTAYFDSVKLIPRNSEKYTYDASNGSYTGGNYIITSEDALGKQNNYTYNINTGNELSFTDARNHTTYYSYDSLNRLIQVRDPLLHSAYYGYDAVSNCTSTRDPRSSSSTDNTYLTSYGPNNLNKLGTLTDPLSRNYSYTYDRSGNLTDILLPNGQTEHFDYDNANRLIKTTYDNGKYFIYTYGNANELISITDQDNNSYSWTYDGAHRLTGSTDNFGYGLTYQWDKSNNLTSLTASGAGNCQYNYGSDNELMSLSLPNGPYIYYNYDESGRVFQVRYPGNYNYRKYNYMQNGWCSQIQDPCFPGQYNYDYYYNDDGTISYDSSWAGSDSFSYDANGRLTYWHYSPMSGNSIQENYSYDNAGNMLTKGSRTFTYNSANQITSTGFSYDNNGNMTGDGTYIYVYNTLNQLIQVKRASDNAVIAEYKYNHDGLRRSKTVYIGQNQGTTNYDWDAFGNLAREVTPGGTNYYYYSPSGDLVGMKINNVTYMVHDNLRGDIVSITDTNGNIVAQYHFDPWGNQISYSGTLTQPFRYASYYYDDETGFYYLKSRYYSPVLGRFLTKDPISYIEYEDPQTLNLYSYCGNDPVNNTDSTGYGKAGDEKLSKSAQNEIKYLTILYGKATSEASRKWIAKQADKIRTLDKISQIASKVSNGASVLSGGAAAVSYGAALTTTVCPNPVTPVIAGVAGGISLGAGAVGTAAAGVAFVTKPTQANAISLGVSASALVPGIPSRKVTNLLDKQAANFIMSKNWSIGGALLSRGQNN